MIKNRFRHLFFKNTLMLFVFLFLELAGANSLPRSLNYNLFVNFPGETPQTRMSQHVALERVFNDIPFTRYFDQYPGAASQVQNFYASRQMKAKPRPSAVRSHLSHLVHKNSTQSDVFHELNNKKKDYPAYINQINPFDDYFSNFSEWIGRRELKNPTIDLGMNEKWFRAARYFNQRFHPLHKDLTNRSSANDTAISSFYAASTQGSLYCTSQVRHIATILADSAFDLNNTNTFYNEKDSLYSEISRQLINEFSICVPNIMDRWKFLEVQRCGAFSLSNDPDFLALYKHFYPSEPPPFNQSGNVCPFCTGCPDHKRILADYADAAPTPRLINSKWFPELDSSMMFSERLDATEANVKKTLNASGAYFEAALQDYIHSFLEKEASLSNNSVSLMFKAVSLFEATQCALSHIGLGIAAIEDLPYVALINGQKNISRTNIPQLLTGLFSQKSLISADIKQVTKNYSYTTYESRLKIMDLQIDRIVVALQQAISKVKLPALEGLPFDFFLTSKLAGAEYLHDSYFFRMSLINTLKCLSYNAYGFRNDSAMKHKNSELQNWFKIRRENHGGIYVLTDSVLDCFDQGHYFGGYFTAMKPLQQMPFIPLPHFFNTPVINVLTLGINETSHRTLDSKKIILSSNNWALSQQLLNSSAYPYMPIVPILEEKLLPPGFFPQESGGNTNGINGKNSYDLKDVLELDIHTGMCTNGYYRNVDPKTGKIICTVCDNRSPDFSICYRNDGTTDMQQKCRNIPLTLKDIDGQHLSGWIDTDDKYDNVSPSIYIPQGKGFSQPGCVFACRHPRFVAKESTSFSYVHNKTLCSNTSRTSSFVPVGTDDVNRINEHLCPYGLFGYAIDYCEEAPPGYFPYEYSNVKKCESKMKSDVTNDDFHSELRIITGGRFNDSGSCGSISLRTASSSISQHVYSDRAPFLGAKGNVKPSISASDVAPENALVSLLPFRVLDREDQTGLTAEFLLRNSYNGISSLINDTNDFTVDNSAFEIAALVERAETGLFRAPVIERPLWSLNVIFNQSATNADIVAQLWLRIATDAKTTENVFKSFVSSPFTFMANPFNKTNNSHDDDDKKNVKVDVFVSFSIDFITDSVYFILNGRIVPDGCKMIDSDKIDITKYNIQNASCTVGSQPVNGIIFNTQLVDNLKVLDRPGVHSGKKFLDNVYLSTRGWHGRIDKQTSLKSNLSRTCSINVDAVANGFVLPLNNFDFISKIHTFFQLPGELMALSFKSKAAAEVYAAQTREVPFSFKLYENSYSALRSDMFGIPSVSTQHQFPSTCQSAQYGFECRSRCPGGATGSDPNAQHLDSSSCICLNNSRVLTKDGLECSYGRPAYGRPTNKSVPGDINTLRWIAHLDDDQVPLNTYGGKNYASSGWMVGMLDCHYPDRNVIDNDWFPPEFPRLWSAATSISHSMLTDSTLAGIAALSGYPLYSIHVNRSLVGDLGARPFGSTNAFWGEQCTLFVRVVDPPLRLEGSVLKVLPVMMNTAKALPPNPTVAFSALNYTVLENINGTSYQNASHVELRIKGYSLGLFHEAYLHAHPHQDTDNHNGYNHDDEEIKNINTNDNIFKLSSDHPYLRKTIPRMEQNRIRRRTVAAMNGITMRFVFTSGLYMPQGDPMNFSEPDNDMHPHFLGEIACDFSSLSCHLSEETDAPYVMKDETPMYIDDKTGEIVISIRSVVAAMAKKGFETQPIWIQSRVENKVQGEKTLAQLRQDIGDDSIISIKSFDASNWTNITVFPYEYLISEAKSFVRKQSPELGVHQTFSYVFADIAGGNPFHKKPTNYGILEKELLLMVTKSNSGDFDKFRILPPSFKYYSIASSKILLHTLLIAIIVCFVLLMCLFFYLYYKEPQVREGAELESEYIFLSPHEKFSNGNGEYRHGLRAHKDYNDDSHDGSYPASFSTSFDSTNEKLVWYVDHDSSISWNSRSSYNEIGGVCGWANNCSRDQGDAISTLLDYPEKNKKENAEEDEEEYIGDDVKEGTKDEDEGDYEYTEDDEEDGDMENCKYTTSPSQPGSDSVSLSNLSSYLGSSSSERGLVPGDIDGGKEVHQPLLAQEEPINADAAAHAWIQACKTEYRGSGPYEDMKKSNKGCSMYPRTTRFFDSNSDAGMRSLQGSTREGFNGSQTSYKDEENGGDMMSNVIMTENTDFRIHKDTVTNTVVNVPEMNRYDDHKKNMKVRKMENNDNDQMRGDVVRRLNRSDSDSDESVSWEHHFPVE